MVRFRFGEEGEIGVRARRACEGRRRRRRASEVGGGRAIEADDALFWRRRDGGGVDVETNRAEEVTMLLE